jgi:hypothetical protein
MVVQPDANQTKELLQRRAIVELPDSLIFGELFKGAVPQHLNLLAAYYTPEMFCFELVVCGPSLPPVQGGQTPRLQVYYHRQTLACGCVIRRATLDRDQLKSFPPAADPFGQLLRSWEQAAERGEANYAICAQSLRDLLNFLRQQQNPTTV